MILFSRWAYNRIGPWDEKFEACGFEDADWGFRASEAGIKQELLPNFPFSHLGGSRWDTSGYGGIRAKNKEYLMQKHGNLAVVS